MNVRAFGLPLASCLVLIACGDSPSSSDSSTTQPSTLNNPCPSSKPPTLVRIGAPGPSSMCIDRTEVTVAQYAAFVADPGAHGGKRSTFCPRDTSDVPDASCMADRSVCKGTACGEHPQVCVNVCSARAYCQWAGKVLCGADTWTQATKTDSTKWGWANACGGGISPGGLSGQPFPYGPKRDPNACNGYDKNIGTTVPVASLPTCQGERDYAGVFDLSGNVGEWVEQTGDEATTHYAGGSFLGTGSVTGEADCIAGNSAGLNIALPDVGFRCCAAD